MKILIVQCELKKKTCKPLNYICYVKRNPNFMVETFDIERRQFDLSNILLEMNYFVNMFQCIISIRDIPPLYIL